jgi:hypothetical protein
MHAAHPVMAQELGPAAVLSAAGFEAPANINMRFCPVLEFGNMSFPPAHQIT